MLGEMPDERLFQLRQLDAVRAGQPGEHLRVAFTGDQRGHHRPPRRRRRCPRRPRTA